MISYHVTQRSSYAAKQEESELLAEEIGNLQSEETSLLEEIDLLNDKEYVLDIARTNYFLSKKESLSSKLINRKSALIDMMALYTYNK